MSKTVLYPGSFDPFTKGHESIVQKALLLFDKLVIGIGKNSEKKGYFTLESRINHLEHLYKDEKRVQILSYEGLTIDLCSKKNINFLLRGLRNNKDFDYEYPISMHNKLLNDNVETIFLCSDLNVSPFQSNIIREIHKSGGNIDVFVSQSSLLRID
ncbi:MAG: pantetheine-phosphate adenylyltransferase [Flavobacteriia bacterium]|nr:pantetheine-phosphate adenylyltransferase [Flavobacteriia bacterium]